MQQLIYVITTTLYKFVHRNSRPMHSILACERLMFFSNKLNQVFMASTSKECNTLLRICHRIRFGFAWQKPTCLFRFFPLFFIS